MSNPEIEVNILLNPDKAKYTDDDDEDERTTNLLIETRYENRIKCCNFTWIICQIIVFLVVLLWIIFILILLFSSQSNMHNIVITYFDSSATSPHDKVVTNCDFTWKNILKSLNSYGIFLFFHFFRHFLTAFILRNRLLLWINSILWEFVEFIISSWSIFHFYWNECWWDSLFFDVLLMNALGIECGLLFIKLINWIKNKKCASWWNGIVLYDDFHTISTWNCLQFILVLWFLIILFKIEEALSFIIFEVGLWSTVDGIPGIYRQIMYFGCSFFAISQFYYLHQQKYKHLSFKQSFWILIFQIVIFIEMTFAIKIYVLY